MPIISRSIVQDSGGSGGTWVPATGTDGGNNLDTDPLFVTTTIPTPPSTAGDYSLSSTTSPAYNTGDNSLYPDTWAKWSTDPDIDASFKTPAFQSIYDTYIQPALAKDLAGNPRLNGTIDMGAYEY
jgi:hypothetical protein